MYELYLSYKNTASVLLERYNMLKKEVSTENDIQKVLRIKRKMAVLRSMYKDVNSVAKYLLEHWVGRVKNG